jgi:glycerophosphoryl diester phosphodiesterase
MPMTMTRWLALLGSLAVAGCSGGDGSAVTARCALSPFRHSPPLVIAHAGGEGLGPANSLLAMRRSLDAGADLLDVDLRMSADGVVVAHHDRSVTIDGALTGNIDELSWEQLQAVDLRADWTGESIDEPVRVASLEQILTTYPGVTVSLEIKQSVPSMARSLCDVLVRLNAVERVYLSANDDDDVYAAQAECPGTLVITTTYRDVAEMRRARATDEAWCAPAPIGQPPFNEGLLDRENVAWSHAHGMAIFTWTVDDPPTLRGLAEAGVDAVYTRRPDIARPVFDEFAAG